MTEKAEQIKRVLSREEELPDCGIMKIKGLCYEDVVSILCTNGYVTEVTTPPLENATQAYHIIKYWKCAGEVNG